MKLLLAFLMDMIIGDPEWIPTPHPIVLIGRTITKCKNTLQQFIYDCPMKEVLEKRRIRKKEAELAGGGILFAVVVGGTYMVTKFIVDTARKIHPRLGDVVETFLIFQSLAAKCLKDEAEKVYDKLKGEDLEGARTQVGYLVGRDTACLSSEEVAKATIETVAENTSDGVIAPVFYAAIGGAPLAMAYKAVNTLDSMVGYKNDECIYIGKISAKMDDVCNFIPSRLSAFAMMAAAYFEEGLDCENAWRIFRRDRLNHLSPNSAQTESVAAGALHIQLGGTHDYFGKPVEKPTIGDDDRPVEAEDIKRTNKLLYGASICAIGVVTLLKLLSYLRRSDD